MPEEVAWVVTAASGNASQSLPPVHQIFAKLLLAQAARARRLTLWAVGKELNFLLLSCASFLQTGSHKSPVKDRLVHTLNLNISKLDSMSTGHSRAGRDEISLSVLRVASKPNFKSKDVTCCPRAIPESRGRRAAAHGTLVPGTHLLPVHDVPPRLDVIRAPVLVLQVVCMLPDVTAKNGNAGRALDTLHQWVVLVGRGGNCQLPDCSNNDMER